ncbi:hypothetical protein Lal_00033979 [Lupinus albus]|nr:hypothetical protein Lal_00033979 [Lupinus albus]
MLLRGKASEDQLQFNPEIEKSAKSNRKKAKAKKKQGVQLESQPREYLAQARDQRPQALATGQFSLRREYLAQASSSRPSELIRQITKELEFEALPKEFVIKELIQMIIDVHQDQ